MSDSSEPTNLDAVPRKAAEAAAALEALREPAARAAASIEDAFGRAGEGLVRSLARAAADGEVSLAELARAVLAAVNAASGSGGGGGLGEAIARAVQTVFSGSRADGGAVLGGGAYLVGERGPEVFRPAGPGVIEAAGGGGGVTVNVRVDGGAPGLLRSEAQIAQMLARAVSLGARPRLPPRGGRAPGPAARPGSEPRVRRPSDALGIGTVPIVAALAFGKTDPEQEAEIDQQEQAEQADRRAYERENGGGVFTLKGLCVGQGGDPDHADGDKDADDAGDPWDGDQPAALTHVMQALHGDGQVGPDQRDRDDEADQGNPPGDDTGTETDQPADPEM